MVTKTLISGVVVIFKVGGRTEGYKKSDLQKNVDYETIVLETIPGPDFLISLTTLFLLSP